MSTVTVLVMWKLTHLSDNQGIEWLSESPRPKKYLLLFLYASGFHLISGCTSAH